jgi:hypothetical protein
LVASLEQLTTEIGGLNVARRIFAQIAPLYDTVQERYHVVNRPQQAGGGRPQIPFGYLLLLAAKHFLGSKPAKNTDENWRKLIGPSTDYAAALDVQEYAPGAFRPFDAFTLVPYLQALALYDTLFRIPQIRGSDVEKIARGVLREFDFDQKRGGGWSVNELLKIGNALLEASRHRHGPHWFDVPKLHAACPDLLPKTFTRADDERHPRRRQLIPRELP